MPDSSVLHRKLNGRLERALRRTSPRRHGVWTAVEQHRWDMVADASHSEGDRAGLHPSLTYMKLLHVI